MPKKTKKFARRGVKSAVCHKRTGKSRNVFGENFTIISLEPLDFPKNFVIINVRTIKEEITHGSSAARRVLFGGGFFRSGALQTADAGSRSVLPDPQMDE
ncbi:hypothetical protein [Dysosmobacter sp.]|uniref:hypothetical protein n=1 Tax=Dysosmobacter sp. TaxID=2591382 RepID=UPI001BB47ACD|nr:hypothetical protein [Dysosmobacter sp.]QUO39673.1 hypothetical protein KFE19_10325 [Dysosmobacter sp. Marseille-Q4140]